MTPRIPLLRALTSALFAGVLAVAALAAAPTQSFDIPAGPAAATLKQFIAQSKVQVLYSADEVKEITTQPVKGELTPTAAAEQMLAGTKLAATVTKNGAISIKQGDASPNAPRAAQTDSDRPGKSKIEDGRLVLDKFEVFGSKSINLDIARTRDDVQPYVVFDHDTIANTGADNLQDFFRSRLPMNSGLGLNTYAQGIAQPNSNSINLRGLGNNQTLILVDGRRLPNVTLGGTLVIPADVNGIPMSMIERIEILPSTASGIYGGSATGGVINIITRKDFSGAVLSLSYKNSMHTDSAQWKADLLATTSLRGGATMITVTASYGEANVFLNQDMDFAVRARQLAFANNPALFTGTSTPPTGYTSNIRNQNGTNLVLKPQYGGTVLNSPFTSVPVGYAGIASDNAAALVANAGRYNLDRPDGFGGLQGSTAVTPSPTHSLGVSLRQKITPWLEGYADFLRTAQRGNYVTSGVTTTTTLAATAPNNPFTTAVNVAFPGLGLGDQLKTGSYTEIRSTRFTGGLVAKLPGDWQAGLDYMRGQSEYFTHFANPLVGDVDGTGPGISYTTALSTGVLDVLRDLNLRPLDYAPYLFPNNVYDAVSRGTSQSATLRASGPVWQLPAGPLVVSTSTEWQHYVSGDAFSRGTPTSGTDIPNLRVAAQNHQRDPLDLRRNLSAPPRGSVPVTVKR